MFRPMRVTTTSHSAGVCAAGSGGAWQAEQVWKKACAAGLPFSGTVPGATAVYERMDAGPRSHVWTDYEAGLASENLLLEAVALRLGAVVVGGMDPAAAKDAVGFPGSEQVIVLIPVGHPAG